MVRSGWALSCVRYSHEYDRDEAEARDAKAGLWAAAFIAPWDWRGRNKQTEVLGAAAVPVNAQAILLSAVSAQAAPDPACTIKGNINRSGECIYHQPGGRWYAKVNMDLSKGKRWFCSVEEAEAAGCQLRRIDDHMIERGNGCQFQSRTAAPQRCRRDISAVGWHRVPAGV